MPKWNHFLKCRTKPASCGNAGSEVPPAEVGDAQAPASPLRGGEGRAWGSLEGEQGMGDTSEIFLFPAVSSGPRGAAAGSGMGEGQDGSGHGRILGMGVSVTAPPRVSLAGMRKHKFQPRHGQHSPKATCWTKGDTFPSSQKLGDTKAAHQNLLGELGAAFQPCNTLQSGSKFWPANFGTAGHQRSPHMTPNPAHPKSHVPYIC